MRKKKPDHPLLFKIIMLVSGLILGLLVTGLTIQVFKAGSESMSPAIKKGNFCLLNKFIHPKRGDMVAIESPTDEDRLVLSRVAATQGDVIEIKNKSVYINGRKSKFYENLKKSTKILPREFSYRDNMPSVKLGKEEFFLISDNYDRAYDSRTFGKIKGDMIFGKIIYVYKP